MREQRLGAGEIEVGLLMDGPQDGELSALLARLPDSAWTWRELLPVPAAAGYRAVHRISVGTNPLRRHPTATTRCRRSPATRLRSTSFSATVGKPCSSGMTGARPSSTPCSCRSRNDGGRRSRCPFRSQAPGRSTLLPRAGASQLVLVPLPAARRRGHRSADDLELVDRLWADWSPGFDGAEGIRRARTASRASGRLAAAIEYYRQSPRRASSRCAAADRDARLQPPGEGATVASGSTSFGRPGNPSRLGPASRSSTARGTSFTSSARPKCTV